MHNGVNIAACFVNRGMDEALEVESALIVAHRVSFEIQLDDVVALHQVGSERPRKEEMLRIGGIANADMAVGIDHILFRQDAVGDDEILNDGVEIGHGGGSGVR